MRIKKFYRGFTLVELTITIGIIAILAAMIAPMYNNALQRGRDGTTYGNLGVLRSAISAYYADTGIYPYDLSALTADNKYLTHLPASMPAGHPDGAGYQQQP